MQRKNSGITLVALVITIIILLILAGVSIASLTESGLFDKAKEAKQKSENAQEKENLILKDYESTLNEYLSGTGGSSSGDEDETVDPSLPINPATTIAEAQSDYMLNKTVNSSITDANGNQIVVPAGFKITTDATTADNGIVIIDANENEFVWIPVPEDGKVYTNTEKTAYKTVELNRYTFDESGVKTAHNDEVIETYFQELATSTYGNTTAKSISTFKTSVTTNKGYYIGRYEARTATERSTKDDEITAVTTKESNYVYNFVTQAQAADLAKNMYTSTKFTSDLMNSYAWDTATLFLQECGTNSKYSREPSVNLSLATTGTNNQETKDVQCNVYDIASNTIEWTTESSSSSTYKCVYRGGHYNDTGCYVSVRTGNSDTFSDIRVSFRPILYINVN